MSRSSTTLLLAVALLVPGCDGESEGTGAPPTETTTGASSSERPPIAVGDGVGEVRLVELGRFERPLHVAQPPTGDPEHIFVVEQCGRIVRAPIDRGQPGEFLDLTDRVTCEGAEQGLLSVAFAPDYGRSGLFYVNYTDSAGDTRVVEFRRHRTDSARADPGSARELLLVDQPYANHNGGLVVFGPDRRLYIGLGDGGSAGDPRRHALDLGSPLGKILRIVPRRSRGAPYRIPARNPFGGSPGGSQPAPTPAAQAGRERLGEILALGLRNPWRFSFDRATGELWVADVGQNRLEEVNGPVPGLGAGANFGWSAYEGTERFNEDQRAPEAVVPALVYGRERGCSVTGGYVVRDPSLRSLFGRYLYGDYCAGELRSFAPRDGEAVGDRSVGLQVSALSSFGEDASGRIYVTSLDGPVHRLAPESDR